MKTSTIVLVVGGIAAFGITLLFLSGSSGSVSSSGPIPDFPGSAGGFSVPTVTSIIPDNLNNSADNLLTDFHNLTNEVTTLTKQVTDLTKGGVTIVQDIGTGANAFSSFIKGVSAFGQNTLKIASTPAVATATAINAVPQAYSQFVSFWSKVLRGGR